MATHEHVFVVILAGGGGTRLWPKSREKTPKQFLRLFGEQSLMQEAYQRVCAFVSPDHVLVITNKDYIDEVHRELPDVPMANIIGEPAKRETAPAMLLGALIAHQRDPDAIVLNQASDHVVTNVKEFVHVSETALEVAAGGESLVTVGILPTYPNTGFGYIQIDGEVKQLNHLPVFKVTNFTEKPNEATAKAFIATGKYFWNANNYVWKASALLQAFERHAPGILRTMEPIAEALDTPEFEAVLEKAYKSVEKIAIDYAISEKADNLVLIPGDFGWDDVGSWSVVYDLKGKNTEGNAIIAQSDENHVVVHDSSDNLIHTHDRLIALVGIHDTIVVDTGEILLVMPKSKAQDVKKIVEHLKEHRPEYM